MSETLKNRVIEAVQREIPMCCDYTWRQLEGMCESPIEIALGTTIIMGMQLTANVGHDAFKLCRQEYEPEHSGPRSLLLMPQYSWQSFRIDWVLKVGALRQPYIFIECDGHEFHERTADQAARDRARDRTVQEAGIPILRYTGREIYRDVQACAAQALDMCGKLFDRQK